MIHSFGSFGPSLVGLIAVELVKRQGITVEACGRRDPLTSGGALNVIVPYKVLWAHGLEPLIPSW